MMILGSIYGPNNHQMGFINGTLMMEVSFRDTMDCQKTNKWILEAL